VNSSSHALSARNDPPHREVATVYSQPQLMPLLAQRKAPARRGQPQLYGRVPRCQDNQAWHPPTTFPNLWRNTKGNQTRL